jgi:hypothetical protein
MIPLGFIRANAASAAVERGDFGIDPRLAHAARDELGHLAAEIDDQDGIGRLDRHGGRIRRRHRGHDNDTGEVLAGVLIGAILTGAVLSSKAKKQRERAPTVDYPEDRRSDDRSQTRRGDIASEDQAVDACAQAAEDKAGRAASVRDINQVRKSSDGWDVEGVVESREGWRDRATERRNFTCSVRYGAVDSVYLEDGRVALNQ